MENKIRQDNQRNQREKEPLYTIKKRRLPMGKEAQDARNFDVPVEEHELEDRYEKYKRILAGLTMVLLNNLVTKRREAL